MLIVARWVLLAGIKWSVCITESQRILSDWFFRMGSDLYLYLLLVWSHFTYLHNSQKIFHEFVAWNIHSVVLFRFSFPVFVVLFVLTFSVLLLATKINLSLLFLMCYFFFFFLHSLALFHISFNFGSFTRVWVNDSFLWSEYSSDFQFLQSFFQSFGGCVLVV